MHTSFNTRLHMFALLLLLAGCGSSTRLVTSWRDPSFSIEEGHYKKMLLICLVKNEGTRRAAEERLMDLTSGHGVASYMYLGDNIEGINAPGMNEKMIADGFDAVLIMRLVDATKEQTYVPGTAYPYHYASPYGYYGYAAPMYYDPGYVRTDVTFYVETNLYSTKDGKLIWTGTTSTLNPSNIATIMDEIVEAIHYRMVREGFVKPVVRK